MCPVSRHGSAPLGAQTAKASNLIKRSETASSRVEIEVERERLSEWERQKDEITTLRCHWYTSHLERHAHIHILALFCFFGEMAVLNTWFCV